MVLTGTREISLGAMVAILAAIVALGLAMPPWGSAHKLELDTARAAAKKIADKIHRETDSESSRVTTCRRKTRHKVVCKVRSEYDSGLRSCVTTVPVRYSSHRDRSPRAGVGSTFCS